MTLITEEHCELPDVSAEAVDEILDEDAFGKFAVLSASDEEFIQAGNDWQPDKACQEYMSRHGSDPWMLEYRESGRQYRADGYVTLDQVRQAFQSYLAGRSEWRSGFTWAELKL